MEWELEPGNTVDGWTLVDRLGKGGNGEVWLAEHPDFGRGALKLLKLKFQGEEHKRYLRFRDEATMHRQLAAQNAGVLPFLGCSLPEHPTRDKPAWLATPVAVPAEKALEGQPLRVAVEAVASVAETLAALHEQGVSHRDIKPDNLFRHCDRWRVGDFGLVDYPDKESLTDTSERLGPYHYLAPEMLTEANRADGRRADVFSLGKTMWVLATGQRVPPPGELRADNVQLSIGAYRADPRNHQLDMLIERATRHAPGLRPTMADFANELRASLAPPVRPATPLDLADLGAKLTELAAPVLRQQDLHRARVERVHRLGNRLENELSTLRSTLASAFKPPAARVSSFTRSDGNVRIAIPQVQAPLAVGPRYNDYRTLSVYIHYPISLTLYSGFGLEQYESGQLRVFGGLVLSGHGRRELVWSVVRVVWSESAEMEHAFGEIASGLNENLRLAVERIVGLVEAQTQERKA